MADAGPQLDQFFAVGVGLAFGALSSCPQVRAQLAPVAGGFGAEVGQHPLGVLAGIPN